MEEVGSSRMSRFGYRLNKVTRSEEALPGNDADQDLMWECAGTPPSVSRVLQFDLPRTDGVLNRAPNMAPTWQSALKAFVLLQGFHFTFCSNVHVVCMTPRRTSDPIRVTVIVAYRWSLQQLFRKPVE